jgi:hypothetical protein
MTATETTGETRRVLDMLAQGKITVDEADQLIKTMRGTAHDAAATPPPAAPRWMRIMVDRPARDGRPAKNVNIRVPLALARSGVRLGAMIPFVVGPKLKEEFRKHGIEVDLSKIDLSDIEAAARDLGETTIDVDEGKAQVRIRCE